MCTGCDSRPAGFPERAFYAADAAALRSLSRRRSRALGKRGGRHLARGFTLIEVLIAVVILSTGLVLVLQGLHAVLHTWDGGVRRMREWMTAQEALSSVRLVARQGGPLVSGGAIRVSGGVTGRDGLYQIVYEAPPDEGGRRFSLDSLLYVPPVREESLP